MTNLVIYQADPIVALPSHDFNMRDCIEAAFEQILPAPHIEIWVRYTEENDTWSVLLWDPTTERAVQYNCQHGSDDSELLFLRVTTPINSDYAAVLVTIPF